VWGQRVAGITMGRITRVVKRLRLTRVVCGWVMLA
jgi:hypothetical protein